jgi:hypothetical protein
MVKTILEFRNKFLVEGGWKKIEEFKENVKYVMPFKLLR